MPPSLHLRKEAEAPAALVRKEFVAMLTELCGLETGLCSQESGDSFLCSIPNSVFNLQVTLAVTPTNASGSPLSWEIIPQNMEGPMVGTTAITMMRATGPPHLTTKGEGWAHLWGVTAGAQVAMAPSMVIPHPLPHHPTMAPTLTALCSWSMAWINLR